MANAMVSTVRPKAKATPRKPMPNCGKAADSTALPQPPRTSQKVPKNSAAARFDSGMDAAPLLLDDYRLTLFEFYLLSDGRQGARPCEQRQYYESFLDEFHKPMSPFRGCAKSSLRVFNRLAHPARSGKRRAARREARGGGTRRLGGGAPTA